MPSLGFGLRRCAWQSPNTKEIVVAANCVIEAVAELCKIGDEKLSELYSLASSMSEQGLRVLGVARAHIESSDLPEDRRKCDFEFSGLLGLYDPPEPTVCDAVKKCYSAGIRIRAT